MRIALISDIHGNALALEAVLADIRHRGADRIVCLGDVATLGPQPTEVLSRLRGIGCTCILGNHDEFLLEPSLVAAYSKAPVIVESIEWALARLRAEELDYVRTFERSVLIQLEDKASLLAFHGTPDSNVTDLLATAPAHDVDQMLGGRRASIMAAGHTHIQMLRQHRGTLIVNPGSVGMPFEEYVGGKPPRILPFAEYAIVESRGGDISVALQRVALDAHELATRARLGDSPMGPWFAAMYSA